MPHAEAAKLPEAEEVEVGKATFWWHFWQETEGILSAQFEGCAGQLVAKHHKEVGYKCSSLQQTVSPLSPSV